VNTEKLVLLLVLMLVAAWPSVAQDRISWKQYVGPSGSRISFPVDVFPRDAGPAEQGTGQRFRTADGSGQLAIYSLSNPLHESPATYLSHRLKVPRANIKYQKVTPRFFVLSSSRNGFIYYSRCNFARRIHCIYMTYPEQEKRAWDRIVTRVSNSLRSSG
jgi:hypothetical protein